MNVQVRDQVRVDLPDLFTPVVSPGGDVPRLKLLVTGRWRPAEGGTTFEVRSPIDGSVIARAAKASRDDVEAAVAAARDSREQFRALPAAARLQICAHAAEILDQQFGSFVDAIVADLGKTPEQATSEVTATRERLGLVREEVRKIFGEYLPGDWIGETAGKAAVVLREPVGTVAAFGPFNYPLFLAASKIIPAIAAGSTVVAKAPSDAPIALVMFARVLEEAGLPPGVLNVVTGSGGEIGDLLASHVDVSMISFTGSSGVGRRIAALAGPKPMHLELGGNGAAIVLADADLGQAVEKSVLGAFKNAGQRCDAVSRVLVEEPVYEDYVERALKEASRWPAGDPRVERTRVGPLVSPDAATRVAGLVGDAVAKGAERLVGGSVADAYHEPTVLAGVPLEADILWEETFGPVLAARPVPDLETALELSNRSRYGLDSAVFTSTARGGRRGRWSADRSPSTTLPPTGSGTSPSAAASRTRASGGRASATRSTSARC